MKRDTRALHIAALVCAGLLLTAGTSRADVFAFDPQEIENAYTYLIVATPFEENHYLGSLADPVPRGLDAGQLGLAVNLSLSVENRWKAAYGFGGTGSGTGLLLDEMISAHLAEGFPNGPLSLGNPFADPAGSSPAGGSQPPAGGSGPTYSPGGPSGSGSPPAGPPLGPSEAPPWGSPPYQDGPPAGLPPGPSAVPPLGLPPYQDGPTGSGEGPPTGGGTLPASGPEVTWVDPVEVPEPSTLLLLGVGLAAAARRRRGSRNRFL